MTDKKLEQKKRIIEALLKMTEENGCTKEEALEAAKKASQLMEEYQIHNINETGKIGSECVTKKINTTHRNKPHIFNILTHVAELFTVNVWISTYSTGFKQIVFFGLAEDVELAEYTYKMLESSCMLELKKYQKTPEYQYASRKRLASNSYKMGMVHGIQQTIDKMIIDRNVKNNTSTGTSLVVLKDQLIKEGMEEKHPHLKFKTSSSTYSYNASHYEKGVETGSKMKFKKGITQ